MRRKVKSYFVDRRRGRTEDGDEETPATRFLGSATLCRIRDLEQLVLIGELVMNFSKLVHALQKE